MILGVWECLNNIGLHNIQLILHFLFIYLLWHQMPHFFENGSLTLSWRGSVSNSSRSIDLSWRRSLSNSSRSIDLSWRRSLSNSSRSIDFSWRRSASSSRSVDLSWQRSASNSSRSIDLFCKSMDCFYMIETSVMTELI